MAEKEIFEYTYSALQRSEVQIIREKYLSKEVTKLDQLRALDTGVTKRGTAVSMIHGILNALILGLGMLYGLGRKSVRTGDSHWLYRSCRCVSYLSHL